MAIPSPQWESLESSQPISSYIPFQKEIKPTPLECIFKPSYHSFSSKEHRGSQGDAFGKPSDGFCWRWCSIHEERASQPGFAWARPKSWTSSKALMAGTWFPLPYSISQSTGSLWAIHLGFSEPSLPSEWSQDPGLGAGVVKLIHLIARVNDFISSP